MLGGFPHSDISGSKPIPGSPKLNAGYHVLHRLLLPRHPPNALFALDLIQEEQGRSFAWTDVFLALLLANFNSSIEACNSQSFAKANHMSKACILPIWQPLAVYVGILDLEQYRFNQPNLRMQHRSGPMSPLLGRHQTILMFLSIRCQCVRRLCS